MFIVTTDTKGHAHIYEADADQAKLFEDYPEKFPEGLSGWVVEDQNHFEAVVPKTAMVKVYNSLTGESLVKFQNKSAGASRTFPLLERNANPFDELLGQSLTEVPLKGRIEVPADEADEAPKEKTVRRGRQDRGIHNVAPPVDPDTGRPQRLVECRAGTKQQNLIDALAKGATMSELLRVTSAEFGGKDWTESSVKSGLYHDVNTLKGYGIRTEVVEPGKPETYVYHLVLPEGVDAPLPPKAKKDNT